MDRRVYKEEIAFTHVNAIPLTYSIHTRSRPASYGLLHSSRSGVTCHPHPDAVGSVRLSLAAISRSTTSDAYTTGQEGQLLLNVGQLVIGLAILIRSK